MDMEAEILVPEEIAVMTLPNVAFFPQALLPLHIFEPRYRLMLKNALATHRLFAVGGLDPQGEPGAFEPLHRVATLGIVRACQENENGTSNLLLQGLARIEVVKTLQETPYRRIQIRTLASEPGADLAVNQQLRARIDRLLKLKQQLEEESPREITRFLRTIDDPEVFVDIAAFNLCESPLLKQKLLETLDVHERLELFSRQLRRDIEAIKLRKRLQGNLPDDAISNN